MFWGIIIKKHQLFEKMVFKKIAKFMFIQIFFDYVKLSQILTIYFEFLNLPNDIFTAGEKIFANQNYIESIKQYTVTVFSFRDFFRFCLEFCSILVRF